MRINMFIILIVTQKINNLAIPNEYFFMFLSNTLYDILTFQQENMIKLIDNAIIFSFILISFLEYLKIQAVVHRMFCFLCK